MAKTVSATVFEKSSNDTEKRCEDVLILAAARSQEVFFTLG